MPSQLEVQIEKLVYGGDGLARLPADAAGRQQVVFVPFTLPGERVAIELNPPRRGRTTARLIEVLDPSPDRVEPACEYFGRCGGCQLQHVRSSAQIELKRSILLETLQRIGGIAWMGPVGLHAGRYWGYRNRIRLHATGDTWGYRYRDRERVLPVTHCPIASPRLNTALGRGLPPGARGEEAELAVNNHDEGLDSDEPLLFGVGAYRYRVSAGSFFQVNRFLTGDLVAAVAEGVEGDTALDLFSGVGLFALPLAAGFLRVEAVEQNAQAAADLRHNAQLYPKIQVVATAALAYLRERAEGPVDLLVGDPPRTGLGAELVAAILRLRPRRMHLVSCDPSTLARDLRGLLAGGYEIRELDLFDLFPQTYHMETVAKLERRTEPGA